MLIQRISLHNFLSYRGTQNATGKSSPVEIDLRAAPLWLIYGTNGSGKSSIFDAITFALFKEHRGSGTEKRGAAFLVSDSADRASVELEVFLNNKPYLIQREIRKTKAGQAHISGLVSERKGGEWVAVKGTSNDVETWVEKNLRMSHKTFVSAVLLRQGEADTFLKAKPKERKERLLEVLDLKFYKQLGELAVSKRNGIRAEVKQIEQRLEGIKKVEDKDIERQQDSIGAIKDQCISLQGQLAKKDEELKNSKSFAQFQDQISSAEKDRKSALDLIEKENLITTNANRFRELDKDIPALNQLHETHDRIRGYEEEMEDFQEKITSAETKLAHLKQSANEKEKEVSVSRKMRDKVDGQLSDSQSKKDESEKKIEIIVKIEKLEAQIKQEEAKKESFNEIMKRANELDKGKSRYAVLAEAIPVLEELAHERAVWANAEKEKEKAESDLDKVLLKFKNAQSELADAKKILVKLTKDKEKKENEYRSAAEKVRVLQKDIEDRSKVLSKKECPLCRAKVDVTSTHAKVHAELIQWKEEMSQAQKDEAALKKELNKILADVKNATETISSLEKELSAHQTSKTMLESKISSITEKIRETKNRIKRFESKAEDWKNKANNLEALKKEKTLLEQDKREWKHLEEARNEVGKIQAILDARKSDLESLPDWSVKDRNAARTLLAELSKSVQNLKAQLKEFENECRKKEKEVEELNKQLDLTAQSIRHFQENLQRTEKQKMAADSQYQQQIKKLPERLSSNPLLHEKSLVEKMMREHRSLANAENEEANLKSARSKVSNLEGQLSLLRKQIDEIPEKHRRDSNLVKKEFDKIQSSVEKAQENLNLANQTLGEMKSAQKEYRKHESALQKIRKQYELSEKLAVAFGRDGLQSQIVQEAQIRIRDAANTTLSHLSNGTWQIELEGEDDNELEILAQDISQPGMPKRPFEYLSGGEKFRVAISLAVAIGQSIAGGRTVETLIIDEGFGSLDEISRDNLVKELRRLSEDILHNGKVVIVSHQEDICEEFAHRIRVYKDIHGAAKVEYAA